YIISPQSSTATAETVPAKLSPSLAELDGEAETDRVTLLSLSQTRRPPAKLSLSLKRAGDR
ncbi:hypothetical protein A2U01_0119600, partial [Trifolium medium]|nr:hypothetical protein [Trifolium medium]